MLQLTNLKLSPTAREEDLKEKAAQMLGVAVSAFTAFRITRQSIDARKKSQVHYVYSVAVSLEGEEALLARSKSPQVSAIVSAPPYRFPSLRQKRTERPVIVGMGPAGLFAALSLARAGQPCLLLERGCAIEQRSEDVAEFWRTGKLSPSSNVQFGEGGAGTFSDGKLTTGTKGPHIRSVFETLVAHGAPEEILYSHKPHVGTDVLRAVVKSIREELLSLGCEIRFEEKLEEIHGKDGALEAITVSRQAGSYRLACTALILAPGHSARDTFAMLDAAGLSMEQKPFAIGLRIEHKQREINKAQFGESAALLPPTDYKLACHLPNGRSAFSFCVCPGGQVVAAASDGGQVVVNGMSAHARDAENINGGLLVGVGPADFPGEDPLAGVRFQEQWEEAAFALGGQNFYAPAQLVGDFLAGKPSEGPRSITPSYAPGVRYCDLSGCLPDYVVETIRAALPLLNGKVRGYANPDAVLTGVETRSSSPLRILRDAGSLQASVRGVYPCGEGAGYAGGIISAAVDGIRVAEALAQAE